jgi:uncharacterized protein (TIGR02246 family)
VSWFVLGGAAVLGLALFVDGSTCRFGRRTFAHFVAEQQPKEKAAAQEEADPDKKAVLANVRTFIEAFNRRDIKTILPLFAEDCVLTESDGTTMRGLKELEEELKETFANEPDAKLSAHIESLEIVAPGVMLEEGKTTFYPDGKTLTAETDYQAVHVKKGNRWVMTRVSSFNRVVLSPYDQLRELEWLIGDWIDEGHDSIVKSNYRWDANKTYLLNEFTVHVKGRKALSGIQRIGRDPLTKQIKSWVFDDDGAYAESLWSSVDDDTWVIRVRGVRADGKAVTMTNQITHLGNDRFRFDAVDRIAGDERLPDFSAVVVRKAPQAKR